MTDFDPRSIERRFLRLVQAQGRPGPAAKRLDLQEPIASDGETDCWSHAWELARRLGARYVEGVCHRGKGIAQHAWVEEDTPFGPRIVETTPGYEDAWGYQGLVVDCSPGSVVDQVTQQWGDMPRASVIQAMIGGGFNIEQVLDTIKETA